MERVIVEVILLVLKGSLNEPRI